MPSPILYFLYVGNFESYMESSPWAEVHGKMFYRLAMFFFLCFKIIASPEAKKHFAIVEQALFIINKKAIDSPQYEFVWREVKKEIAMKPRHFVSKVLDNQHSLETNIYLRACIHSLLNRLRSSLEWARVTNASSEVVVIS